MVNYPEETTTIVGRRESYRGKTAATVGTVSTAISTTTSEMKTTTALSAAAEMKRALQMQGIEGKFETHPRMERRGQATVRLQSREKNSVMRTWEAGERDIEHDAYVFCRASRYHIRQMEHNFTKYPEKAPFLCFSASASAGLERVSSTQQKAAFAALARMCQDACTYRT